MRKYLSIFICSFVPLWLSGCVVYSTGEESVSGGSFYINPYKFPGSVNMVALFELDNKSSHQGISEDVTKELYHNMQQNALFGTNLIAKNNPKWGSYRLDSYSNYTIEEYNKVLSGVNCDAVLIGVITEYQPYPYMHIGLRLKLIDLRDGQLLWAYENSWNSTDRNTKQRMKDFYRRSNGSGRSELQEEILSISSKNFIKFISSETTETLQEPLITYNN
jgi:hypothetical protein